MRLSLLTFFPIIVSVAIMEIFELGANSDATLALILMGGAASIVMLIWVSYRSFVWAQKVAVQRAAADEQCQKNE